MPLVNGRENKRLYTSIKSTHPLDIVKPVPILIYMTQEIDNGNLLDFTAYKLRNMVESMAAVGQLDLAEALLDALEQYTLGYIDITWQDGWPYTVEQREIDT